ncbi:TIGR03000 domain-containing protein [Gemmata sp. G18]|uniref:TIGR03000 domain-containing protein n=1 Tax=Gemmata palustris TaxID=2822762 RepID=A0ABS5C3F8_9BACT|nr:TIGR03000 domain-containing protein [Gemmata palustris]MBP3960222.1 TIGR03000 domain-containing protein [Gemmata palustris]
MYSIVLMTALTASPDAPQFNGYFRDMLRGNSCNGCNGCSGGVRYSCYGGGCSGAVAYPTSCSGCSGSSCYGSSCCGGSLFGLGVGDRVRSWFEPSGCCGSRSYNCSGASYSCSGYSCSGYSCSGSAYSCFGSSLSCQGGYPMFPSPGMDQFPPYPSQPLIPYADPSPAPGTFGLRPATFVAPGAPPTSTVANTQTGRASVIVKLPADARLSADGRALNLTGAERQFVSPELPLNQEFVYRFKVEYERDGETVSVTKKVNVRAGGTVTIEFTDLTASKPPAAGAGKTTSTTPAAPASTEPTKAEPPVRESPAAPTGTGDRATITVKLPPGATLYVDDRKSPSKDAVRQFATPPLPANREFAYLLKAEILRDGQPETLTQKVPFRAGERITVDFTSLGGK